MPTPESDPETANMTVCYFGTYESQYPRNRIFINGLKELDQAVRECHVPLWERQEHKGAGFGFSLTFILQFLWAQIRLLFKFMLQPNADVIIVGYIGHLDMFLAWFLAKVTGAKLVFNPLVSLYDTVVGDRGFVDKASLKAKLFMWLDRISCKLADVVILDTDAHIKYFKETLDLGDIRFAKVWVGADDQVFQTSEEIDNDQFLVLFVGKFIPLHGLPKIIRAAKLLESSGSIRFKIIGDGQLKDEIQSLVQELQIRNISFVDYVPYNELMASMRTAQLILGIFGDSDKSKRVIPNKLYQALATGKAVLSADTVAARELLKDGETAFLCEATPESIAHRIRAISASKESRVHVARAGYELYKRELTNKALSQTLLNLVQD